MKRFLAVLVVLTVACPAHSAGMTDEQDTVDVSGFVRSVDGKPLSGISVIIGYSSRRHVWSGYPRLEGEMKAVSDARGRFKLVLPKEFRSSGIRVETPAQSRMRLWSIAPPGRFLEMRMSAKRPVTLDIRMKAGSQTVSGKVTTESGKPLKGVVVTLKRGPGMGQAGGSSGQSLEATTDARGAYRFRHLLPGTYSVVSVIPERASGLVPMKKSWRGHGGVRTPGVGAGKLNFTLKQGCSIRGRVLDEQGKPIEGAEVSAGLASAAIDGPKIYQRAGNFSDSVKTDADGRYTLRGLTPETYQVTAGSSDDGRFAPSHPVTGLRLETVKTRTCQDIVLVKGGTLEGTVKDANGKPVHGVTVKYGKWFARTDARGRYRFTGLPTGAFEVTLIPPAGSPWAGQTAGKAPCMAKLGLVHGWSLEKGGSVTGVVRGEDGKPIAGLNVYTSFMSYRYSTVTDKAGRYRLTGLVENHGVDYKKRPRLYGLGVSTPTDSPYMSAGAKFSIRLGEEQTHDITLSLGGMIEGEVKTTDGKPVADAKIAVFKKVGRGGRSYFGTAGPGPGAGVRTDAEGRFTVRKIPSGSVTVSANTREDVNLLGASRENVRVTAGEATKVTLTLKAGGEISGTVTDPKGKAILGAQVALAGKTTGRRRGWGRQIRPVNTDERGRYSFVGLDTGTYVLNVTVHDGKHIVAAQDVTVEAGTRTVPKLRVCRGAFIEVKLRGPDGKPVTRASVSASSGTRGARSVYARVDESGVALIGPLLPGTYAVQVSPGAPRTGAKALERTTLTDVTVKEAQRIKRSVKLKVSTKPTPVELERRRQGGPKRAPGGGPPPG